MAVPPIEIKKQRIRDKSGRYISSDEPLVQVTVNNPLTALKAWISKLLANEGVDVRLKIHPLTMLLMAGVLTLGGFGLGRITVPAPIVKYLPQFAPQASPILTKDTAFTGFLRYSSVTKKYYLETGDGEAVTLTVPATINLGKYAGRRIFATGSLNLQTQILHISDATDLELLPTQVTTIPETIPPISPTPESSL